MAIVSFWSGNEKSSAQTLSAVAVATHMSIEHNYKIIVIDANFNDDTIERCFWNTKTKKSVAQSLNKGKIDLASGAEGLVSAVASNKTSPEIVKNYTKVVFKNRLDVLLGLKTKIFEDYEKSLMLYKDLINTANKYYDFVFVDLPKTVKKDYTRALLDASTVIVYTMPQNLKLIDEYMANMNSQTTLKKGNVIPVLANAVDESKYNVKNTTRYVGEKMEVPSISYNSNFMEAASEAGVANFFLKTRLTTTAMDKNSLFVKSVDSVSKRILLKMQELKYQV
jgi:cellulose biosynthesis protein BcsQ